MILHERWFTDEVKFPVQFDTWSSANSIVPVAVALGITIVATAIWRVRGRRSVVPGPIAHAEILGIAFFLFTTGRGPLAFDMALGKLNKPLAPLIPYAVPVLRVSLGIGLTVVAFTEKLWNIPMGLAFLSEHHFNFFPYIGLPSIDDTKFLLIAG